MEKTKKNGITWDFIQKARLLLPKEISEGKYLGIWVGDEECYSYFWHSLKPYIAQKHQISPERLENHRQRHDFTSFSEVKYSGTVITSRIRIARNLAGYNFLPLMSLEDKYVMCQLVKEALKDIPGRFMALEKITSDDENLLRELKMYPVPRNESGMVAGLYKDWPHGRAVFLSEDQHLAIWVNEEDHLRIMTVTSGLDFSPLLKRLEQIHYHLSQSLKFSHDPRLGYLSTCPTNLGTGMRASVHLRCNKQERKIFLEAGLQIRGQDGDIYEPSDINDVSVSQRLGITESEIIQKLLKGILAWSKNRTVLADT